MDQITACKIINTIVQRRKDSQSRLGVFTEFGPLFAQIEATRSRVTTEPSELQQLGLRLLHVARDQLFLAFVIERKLIEIFRGCAMALNEHNILVAAYCARAAMEHVGASAFFESQAQKLVNSIGNQQSFRKITEALDKADKWNRRGYYGTTVPGQQNQVEPIHISDSIRALDDLASRIESKVNCSHLYDELCQLVHPNYGSNLMAAEGALGEGRLRAAEGQEAAVIARIVESCAITDELSEKCRWLHARSLIEIDEVSQRALGMQTSIAKAFALRKPATTGTGQSPDDPLTFPRARSHFEELRMLYEHLEEHQLSIINRGGLQRPSQDCWIEQIVTESGVIWVQYLRTNL